MSKEIKLSAGLLLYRKGKEVEVLLVHPGGPYWKGKDEGAWTIPKGEIEEGEDAFMAACREFEEETGFSPKDFIFCMTLKKVATKKKSIQAFLMKGDLDDTLVVGNDFEMEWPKGSGKVKSFPEIDMGKWFKIKEARKKIRPVQISLLDQLIESIFV